MTKKTNGSIKWAIRSLSCLIPILAVTFLPVGESGWRQYLQPIAISASLRTQSSYLPPGPGVPTRYGEATPAPPYRHIATLEEARAVAENWLRFIVERDGHWGGARSPSIGEFTDFRRGDLLLGYYASVEPQGYIIISSLKDFAPIKAYSTTSNLDPDKEVGMCDLLKDALERRNGFLIDSFGGLDEVSLQELDKLTLDANRLAWSYLLRDGSALSSHLRSIHVESVGPVGPLLESHWAQGPPYNDDCPDLSCPGAFNHNALVGCVPLAMAQVMRYYAWPPFYDWTYDWPNMLVNEAHYDTANNWYNDENGIPWTQAQIDAVADLCYDAGRVLGGIEYGCSSTSAYICNWYYHDAQDAFEDDFYYDTDGNEPECEDRDDYDYEEWWNMIKNEIDHNRPMAYGIENSDNEFFHAIVVDGYDDSGGQHRVHANYGWGVNWHNNWYDLDWFDCDTAYGWNLRCDWEEEELIRYIYPRNGLCGTHSGTLGPWGGPETLHHYVYCDATSSNLIVQGGARVQFLPGTSITCSANTVEIYGKAAGPLGETRFFSEGPPTRGLKVDAGGKIKLHPNGSIRVH